MPRGVYERTPEMNAANSKSKTGIPRSPEHGNAISKALTGVPHTPEHCAATSAGKTGVPRTPEACATIKNSDANKAQIESMRGGNDIVGHHYIYDHSDLSKCTVKMTRSMHTKLHRLLQKLGYKVPHINEVI